MIETLAKTMVKTTDDAAKVSDVAKTSSETGKSFNPDTRAELSKSEVVSKSNDPDTRALIKGKTSEDVPFLENKDGKKLYYDTECRLYRVDKELIPNNTYELNGYRYKTDDQGRISSVSGKLHLKEHKGRLDIEDSLNDIGKGDEHGERDAMGHPMDDRGHLIGDQFGGPNRMENIISQDAKVNQGIYKSLEDYLAKQVKNGRDVRVDIKVVYDGESRRPNSLVFKYSIDGEKNMKIFPNDRRGL